MGGNQSISNLKGTFVLPDGSKVIDAKRGCQYLADKFNNGNSVFTEKQVPNELIEMDKSGKTHHYYTQMMVTYKKDENGNLVEDTYTFMNPKTLNGKEYDVGKINVNEGCLVKSKDVVDAKTGQKISGYDFYSKKLYSGEAYPTDKNGERNINKHNPIGFVVAENYVTDKNGDLAGDKILYEDIKVNNGDHLKPITFKREELEKKD